MSALLKSSLKSSFIVILFMSLVTLTSCGKKDSTESAGDNKESSENKSNESSDDGGDIDMSSGEFVIEYEMEGPEVKGTMTLYRKGEDFKTVMNGDFGGMSGGSSMALYEGGYVYTVMDMGGKKTGIKLKVDDYKKDKDNFDMKDIEKQLDKYKMIGTETILGKECEIYDTGEGTTMSIYDKKAVLRVKSKDMTMTATKMDTSPDLSASEFDVPTDVEFMDMDEMMKGMKNLKNIDPKNMKIPDMNK